MSDAERFMREAVALLSAMPAGPEGLPLVVLQQSLGSLHALGSVLLAQGKDRAALNVLGVALDGALRVRAHVHPRTRGESVRGGDGACVCGDASVRVCCACCGVGGGGMQGCGWLCPSCGVGC